MPEQSKVLIIDDESIIHESIARILSDEKIFVESAFTGEDGLNKLSTDVDLVVCDINLQEENGIDVIRKIKEKNQDIEIILLSGFASLENTSRALGSGARDFLKKPIDDIESFVKKVKDSIMITNLNRKVTRESKSLQTGFLELQHLLSHQFMSIFLDRINQNIQEGIVVLSQDDKIIYANPIFLRLVNAVFDAIHHDYFTRFIKKEDFQIFQDMLLKVKTNQTDRKGQFDFTSNFGEIRPCEILCSPIFSRDTYFGTLILLNDLTSAKRVRQKLDLLATALDSSQSEMVVIVDDKRMVSDCNERTRSVLGYPSNLLLLKPVSTILKQPTVCDKIWENLEFIQEISIETDVIKSSGASFPAEIFVSKLSTSSGKSANYIFFIRDITSRKETERLLKKAKESAELANQLKTDFIANMNHELRTPLHVIIGAVDLLNKRNFLSSEPEAVQLAQILKRSCDRLNRIISQILELQKIESEKMDIRKELFLVEDLLVPVRDFIGISTAINGVEFSIENRLPEGFKISTDKYKFFQCILNLLDNAKKFTAEGHVDLRIWNREAKLFVEIQDTGVGFENKYLSIIFEPFTQADGSLRRKIQGAGLGLSITQQYVKLLGGKLSAVSKPGKGSTFSFWIPI